MALHNKVKTILGSKISKFIENQRNPIEELEYSIAKQQELLVNVKKGIADLTASKKKLEARKAALIIEVGKLDTQAKDAMRLGNENLTRAILERKNKAQQDIVSLTQSIANITNEQQKLTESQKLFELKIDELKSTKDTLSAEYTAAKTSAELKESLSGLGNTNVGEAVNHARTKTEEMKARSQAVDELVDIGVISDSVTGENSIDRELSQMTIQNQTDTEFKKIKRSMLIKKNDLRAFNK